MGGGGYLHVDDDVIIGVIVIQLGKLSLGDQCDTSKIQQSNC